MKIDSHLEDRSSLHFTFYGGFDAKPHYETLSFAENVKVKETASSKLQTYQPIGRNGSVYVHTGSDSRKFTVEFNLTLPHIIANTQVKDDGLSPLDRFRKKKAQKDQYVQNLTTSSGESSIDAKDGKSYVRAVDMMFEGYLDSQERFASLTNLLGGAVFNFLGSGDDARVEAISKVLFWLNLIRCTTMTHSKKPQWGPPIVRLNHGIMYQNVPCVVNNYSINVDDKAGYDNKTLMPRVISVSLQMSEVRITSREDYNPIGSVPFEYDRDVGWDVVTDGYVSFNRITDESIQTGEEQTP